MMVTNKIIAISPEDGWAFIKNNGKTFLLRPPFTASNLIEVKDNIVDVAVSTHGFDKCNVKIESISDAIRIIKQKFIKTMEDQKIKLPSSEELRELLKYASEDILSDYMDKAKNEFIPRGQFIIATTLASELLKLENVKENPELVKKGTEILLIWFERYMKKEKWITDNLKESWTKKFPTASKKYNIEEMIKTRNAILARGQLLCLNNRED